MDAPQKRILIVEDESRLADILRAGLGEHGFAADIAADGYTGRAMAQANHYDLVILDINLPLINGYDLCREIRQHNPVVAIIMLTAMGTSANKLSGFDAGADDYVVKPFDFRELLARINVFLRRAVPAESPGDDILTVSDLQINLSQKTVQRSGKTVELTAKELALLEYLVRHAGKVVSRQEIAEKIWDLNFDTGTNYIDVYINYLRRKIDRDHPVKLIHTRVGLGYVLKDQNQPE